MASMGVSKLGRMDLIFIDVRVKINGVYYREVLLTLKQLREICGEFFLSFNKAMLLLTERVGQSNFWKEKHLRSFHQNFSHPTA